MSSGDEPGPVVNDYVLSKLFEAIGVGRGLLATQDELEAELEHAVRWAWGVYRDGALLDAVLGGDLALRITGGEMRFVVRNDGSGTS
jgi:hypothetical protein